MVLDLEKLQRLMIVYRAKHNISQKELADLCSVTLQTICYVENGNKLPSKVTIQKILNIVEE